jgi:hypothetical protein
MSGGFPTLAAEEADQRDSGRDASDQRLGSDLGKMLPIGSHYSEGQRWTFRSSLEMKQQVGNKNRNGHQIGARRVYPGLSWFHVFS